MEKIKIILDCDPGHDDAIAIILASKHPNFELLGITTESGNQTIEKTSKNAFNIAKYLNIDVPIVKGATKPLEKEVEVCEAIHGESGLDGFTFPDYKFEFYPGTAANFIINTCKKYQKVTIVTTGPMTNLALALNEDPSIKEFIEEVVVMGGSIANGNVTPAAEFNILCDPEAADIVFRSGLKIKMCGLDVTRKVLVLPTILEKAKQINTKSADLFVKLMEVFNYNQKKVFGFEGAPLHDPVTLVSMIDENVVTFKYVNVEIDVSKQCSYGRTNCDVSGYLKREPNAYVAVDINVEKYWDIILKTLEIE